MSIASKFQTKFIILSLALNAFLVKAAQAQTNDPLTRMKNTAGQVGFTTANIAPQTIIVNVVLAILGFVGLLFGVMVIYSGLQIITSGGNEEKIKDAKKRLYYAVIGLLVIIAAYAITVYVSTILINSTTSGYYSP